MPIWPNRSGFSELMMQYTYLPRLCGWPLRSASTRSTRLRSTRPFAGFLGETTVFARLTLLPFARGAAVFLRRPAATGAALRPCLGFGFGMFPSAGAARSRVGRRAVLEHLANLDGQVFRQ